MKTCICFKGDPTRTTNLRKRFVNQFKQRFNAIKYETNRSINDNDCFGLKDPLATTFIEYTDPPPRTTWRPKIVPIPYNSFKFDRDPTKIAKFMDWLKTAEENSIFQTIQVPRVGQGIENIWANTYIYDAYKHGVYWARSAIKKNPELMKKLNLTPSDISTASVDIEGAIQTPTHADRIGVIYTRTYNDLEGITATMDAQISRTLAEGLSLGQNPVTIARDISNRIEAIGIHRATVLARTEVIRAHHMASIQAYRNFGVEGVKVNAEWITAGDSRVCELCAPLNGKVFKLNEIEGKIPVHPQCRCAVLPVVMV
jgi:SPP1 gp7 family putative phage head morphogenesis protein